MMEHLKALPKGSLQKITKEASIEAHFKARKAYGDAYERTYWLACDAAGTAPMSGGISDAYAADSALDRKNPIVVKELAQTMAWVLSKLKSLGPDQKLNLQDLYSSKMPNGEGPGDITLYRVFEKLISCGAAEGVSPYAINEWDEHIHQNHSTMNIVAGPNIEATKSICTVAQQSFEPLPPGKRNFSDDWDIGQKPVFVYVGKGEGQTAAELGFLLLNEPEHPEARGFRGPSLSVGDIVEVAPLEPEGITKCFLCANLGWDEKVGTLAKIQAEIQAEKKSKRAPQIEPQGMC